MPESRLIRRARERQAAQELESDVDDLIEALAACFPELLLDALRLPEVRAAIHNITMAAAKPTKARDVASRRGGRRA